MLTAVLSCIVYPQNVLHDNNFVSAISPTLVFNSSFFMGGINPLVPKELNITCKLIMIFSYYAYFKSFHGCI